VTRTLIFQCVENERRPAPFAELSFESASLMKSMRVFCADAGGVVAGGVAEAPSLADAGEPEVFDAPSVAAEAESPLGDETGAVGGPFGPDAASVVGPALPAPDAELASPPAAGDCVDTGRLAPAYA